MNKTLNIFIALIFMSISISASANQLTIKEGTDMNFGMQVVMTATPGNGEKLAAIMLKASELVAPLKGCKIYIVQLSTSEKDSVLITEVWDTKEDHQASLSLPAVRALIGEARPLIASMTHQVGKPLGGQGL